MSEHVNLAIVGCGSMTYNAHAQWINSTGEIRVIALCDTNRAAAEKLRRDHFKDDAHIAIFEDWRELLKCRPAGIAGVLFVTPHAQHYEQCMAALEHGWHVLVEKPMVTNSAHARAIISKAQQKALQVQVAFQAPFSAQHAYIREFIAGGDLGALQAVGGFVFQDWQRPWRGTWRQDPAAAGGGFIYDSGAHLLNAWNYLIGRPAASVHAMISNEGLAVDVNGAVNIRYQGGVLASAVFCGNSVGWQEGIWLAGERGRIHTGIHGERMELWDPHGRQLPNPQITATHYTPPQNFAHSLLGRAAPRAPARLGLLHCLLMEAVYKSASNGCEVAVEQE